MPSVDVAMRRSLGRGFLDLFVASMRPVLQKREGTITRVANEAADVKLAFSSWDNCMQANFCKWPIIAIIIIGGVIIISVLWCIIRCCCCGLSCCCQCFYCLKCCGNCCGMCDPPKGRPHKYLDESYHHGPTRGYQPQAPMATGAVGGAGAYAAGRSTMASHSPPQYAEFDVSKKGPAHEDALPEMPTWESASKKKVLVEDDSAVEMDQLKKPPGTADAASVSSQMPLMSGASPGPSSPQSPNRGPYGNLGPGGGSYGQDPAYGSGPSFQGQDQGYGVAGAAPVAGAAAHGRNSPHGGYYNANGGRDPYGNGYGQNPSYDQNAGYRSVSPHHGAAYDDGYGRQSPSPVGNGHYAAAASYDRRSPVPPRGGPGAAGYDSAASSYRGIQPSNPHQQHHAQRQYSTDSMRTGGGYSHAPLPQQQPQHQNNGPYPLNLHNSGGFDFVGSSGYSRPGAAQAVNGYDAYGGGPPRPHNDGAGRGW